MSNSSQFAKIQKVLDKNGDYLMEKHGVEVVYIGFKEVDGKETDEYAIVCGVKQKLAKELGLGVGISSGAGRPCGWLSRKRRSGGDYSMTYIMRRYKPMKTRKKKEAIGADDLTNQKSGTAPFAFNHSPSRKYCQDSHPISEIIAPMLDQARRWRHERLFSVLTELAMTGSGVGDE